MRSGNIICLNQILEAQLGFKLIKNNESPQVTKHKRPCLAIQKTTGYIVLINIVLVLIDCVNNFDRIIKVRIQNLALLLQANTCDHPNLPGNSPLQDKTHEQVMVVKCNIACRLNSVVQVFYSPSHSTHSNKLVMRLAITRVYMVYGPIYFIIIVHRPKPHLKILKFYSLGKWSE